MNNNIVKLCNYMHDCVRESLKSSSFRNLKSCKDNKIIITDLDIFESDNKEIIDLMTLSKLNQSTMDLLQGQYILSGKRGKDVYFTPLLYCNAEFKRIGDKIKLETEEEKTLNIGAISSLLSNNEEEIELIISQLLEVETADFITVLKGLIDLDGFEILDKKAVILAKLPEATAGVLRELQTISEYYCKDM